jgi:hypothetical protein
MAKFQMNDFQFSEVAGLRVKHAQRSGMRLLAEVGIISHGKEVYRETLDLNNGDLRYRLALSVHKMHPGDWETWLAGGRFRLVMPWMRLQGNASGHLKTRWSPPATMRRASMPGGRILPTWRPRRGARSNTITIRPRSFVATLSDFA